jgi:hypothetical protein
VGVFKGETDDLPPSDLEAAGDWLHGYLAHGELVGCDVGESMVVGGVEEGRLFESLEDGLADYLHQLIYSRLLCQTQSAKSTKQFTSSPDFATAVKRAVVKSSSFIFVKNVILLNDDNW